MQVSQLNIYPIKSLGGISLNESIVETRGLKFDRRWMLTDLNNRFLTQREFPILAQFGLKLNGDFVSVENKSNKESISIPIDPITKTIETVQIWDDNIQATIVSDNVNEWFSDQIKSSIRLFFQHDSSHRPIDSKYAITRNEHTSMSDGYPILIVGEESLRFLNNQCPEKIPMDRFRPNIVFKSGDAFCEDDFKSFKINDTELFGVKPCARCKITTINQNTLEIGKEPLATLAKFRKKENKILFGQNVVVHNEGVIKVGNILEF